MDSLKGFIIISIVLCCSPNIAAQRWECKSEQYAYAPDRYDEFCVFRNVQWKKGAPQPEFVTSTATKVAFVASNFTRLPDSFFQAYGQLECLAVRNTSLEVLPITNRMKCVYAVENQIKSLQVQGGKAMKLTSLSLRGNPFSDVNSIVQQLPALEWLDLSETDIASNKENTIDLVPYARLVNLTELYVSNVQAYYLENEESASIPSLKLLDVTGNPFTPSNFHLRVFRTVPNLEELFLRGTMMSDLAVSDIRDDLPTLKRIHLDGNDFKCLLLNKLLAHLNEKGIEALGESTQCHPGYDNVHGLCCKSYNDNIVIDPPKNVSPTDPPEHSDDRTTTSTTTPSIPVPRPTLAPTPVDTTKTGEEAAQKEDGVSVGLVVIIVIGVLALILAAAIGYIVMQKKKHQPVPTRDNAMNDF